MDGRKIERQLESKRGKTCQGWPLVRVCGRGLNEIDSKPVGFCVLGKVVIEYDYHCLKPIVRRKYRW